MKLKMITVLVFFVAMLFPMYAQSENDFEIKQNADNTLTSFIGKTPRMWSLYKAGGHCTQILHL